MFGKGPFLMLSVKWFHPIASYLVLKSITFKVTADKTKLDNIEGFGHVQQFLLYKTQ